MEACVPYLRLTFGSSFAYVLAQVGLALVLFGLAIWFMRRELVPIEHLGVAAEALGKGREVPDFAFSGGTREVRNAAIAFHTMGIRLRRSIQQRTEMLAGVSHDLRTPLTRMKLSLAHAARLARGQGAGRRRRRHGAHDRGLSRLRPRRGRRGDRAGGSLRHPRGRRRRRAARQCRGVGDLDRRHERRAAADRHQALHHQPRLQRAAPRHDGRNFTPPAAGPRSRSRSTTTGRAFPRSGTRTCSARSCGWTNRATSTPAARASASPSPATLRAAMAATSPWPSHRWADCAWLYGCRV